MHLCIQRKPDLLRNVLYGNHFLAPKGLCVALTLLFSQQGLSTSPSAVACRKFSLIPQYFLSNPVLAVEHPLEQRRCPLGTWKRRCSQISALCICIGFSAKLAGTRSLVFGSFYLAPSAVEGQTRPAEHNGRAVLTAHVSVARSLPVGAGCPHVFPGRGSLLWVSILHHVPLACLLRYQEPKGLNKCVVRAQPQLPPPRPGLVGRLEGKEPSSRAAQLRCAQQAAGVLRGTVLAGAHLALASLLVSPQPPQMQPAAWVAVTWAAFPALCMPPKSHQDPFLLPCCHPEVWHQYPQDLLNSNEKN